MYMYSHPFRQDSHKDATAEEWVNHDNAVNRLLALTTTLTRTYTARMPQVLKATHNWRAIRQNG